MLPPPQAPQRRPLLFVEATAGGGGGAAATPQTHVGSDNRSSDPIRAFHSALFGGASTPLVQLPPTAAGGLSGTVYVKDEGTAATSRLGLGAFKVLGASWAVFEAVSRRLGLSVANGGDDDGGIDALRAAVAAAPTAVRVCAATAGNHGRAVARVGAAVGVSVDVFVPSVMREEARAVIRGEGAEVRVVDGSYDDAVKAAFAWAEKTGAIMVQDTAFEGYEDIPRWIVEGYSTMLQEIDEQLPADVTPDLVIVPVGVGSLAQAVVAHYKNPARATGRQTTVLAVEPDTAACLWKSLARGKPVSIDTTPTIMAGMECGTVSELAWPVLSAGLDACATVSDYEVHRAVGLLSKAGVDAGPCGAAPLAALLRLSESDRAALRLGPDSVVVLLCSEGARAYAEPAADVAISDPVELTQALIRIDSSNPAGGSTPGPGETAVARYVAGWLEHRDIESHWVEPTAGRPSVVGVLRGTGGGPSLMWNGHLDTVTLLGYDGDGLSGEVRDGRVFGRGAADMKSGVAAALVAMARLKAAAAAGKQLRGDMVFAGVADEEALSIGTEDLLASGWRADAAIVGEPTDLDIVVAHKGFVWMEVDVHGVAGHGSRPAEGVDAIAKAGHFLAELDRHATWLQAEGGEGGESAAHKLLGRGSVHASLVRGGEEVSSYAARCTVTLERRTVPGETSAMVAGEVQGMLDRLAATVPQFRGDARVTFSRSPLEVDEENTIVKLVRRHVEAEKAGGGAGGTAVVRGETFWTDAALLGDAGIPAVVFGPKGAGLHSKEEWADVESIRAYADILVRVATEFCA
ncbi:hypothetical protein HK405_016021 [Cladochytrium tenue]|nr:hypothetical protein HK405_016021 [Cladochytrium tenue]